jgi:cytochrome c553
MRLRASHAWLALALCGLSTPALADRAFGEYLSSSCVTCHLPSGRQVGGVPAIVGWPEDQFVAVLGSYRSKDRDNEVMRTIAAGLKDDEIAALAAYFGSLKPQ